MVFAFIRSQGKNVKYEREEQLIGTVLKVFMNIYEFYMFICKINI